MPYGYELILDLVDCDASKFNRTDLGAFVVELCERIDMVRADLHFWDYDGYTEEEMKDIQPHLKGTSLVQFIMTSTIVIHTLDDLKQVYLNLFTCKPFDVKAAWEYIEEFFGGRTQNYHYIERGKEVRNECCVDCTDGHRG